MTGNCQKFFMSNRCFHKPKRKKMQGNGSGLFATGRSSTGTARQESCPPILQIVSLCKSCLSANHVIPVYCVGCRREGETPVEPRGKREVLSSPALVHRFQKQILHSFFRRAPRLVALSRTLSRTLIQLKWRSGQASGFLSLRG